ncbi:hypothetical protein QQ045_006556 [Rhodiola kirilowii]
MSTVCLSAMGTSYDDKALKGLLDAFGYAFSLQEIASAFCQAGKDADIAAELLYKSEGYSSSSATCGSSSDTRSMDSSDGSYFMVSSVNGNMKKTKQIWRPVSTGTVSGKLGKDYVSSKPLRNDSYCSPKPVKVESQPSLTSNTYEKEDFGRKEMEDFLFDLLGVGFKLDRSQIQTVLGQCGYDIHKSMQELLNISAGILASSCKNADGSTGKSSRDSCYTQRRQPGPYNEIDPSDAFRSKLDREMKVLAALFTPSERPSEPPRSNRAVNDLESSITPMVVTDLADGSNVGSKMNSAVSSQMNDHVDAELEPNSFHVLRRAVKDYLATKKEYYRAAVEAHAEGDHARAAKFLEQGEFFHQKARQADEESVQKIFETRPNAKKTDDIFTLDLHDHGPKEAIRLLKCHLPMLSAFNYLKLIVNTNDKDITKGLRKRKIIKLLKEQSIQWIQGSEAGTILISVGELSSVITMAAV